jgi:hypothetical protein
MRRDERTTSFKFSFLENIVGVYVLACMHVLLTGPVSRSYYSYDPSLYVGDAAACLWFGLLWLAMIVVEEEIL